MRQIAFLFLLLVFFACKRAESDKIFEDNKSVLQGIIVTEAKKYGLEDSIDMFVTINGPATSKSNVPEAPTVEAYTAWVNALFSKGRESIDQQTEFRAYLEKRKTATSIPEIYEILESYPRYFKTYVEGKGGMEAYQKDKAKYCAPGKYDLYLDKEGNFVYTPAGQGFEGEGAKLLKGHQ